MTLRNIKYNNNNNVPFLYSASHKKGNPYIELIFQKTVMIYQKRLTFLQNSVYPLSFDTSYKMYWPCMNKHWPFQMVMSKMICAEWEFKGLTGSATFQNKGTCWKTFIGISFVSFVMFLLLRLLILTWISEFELGHITQHHYSAQIVFDMHEFKLFPFIHALRYHYVFGIKWKKRKCSW